MRLSTIFALAALLELGCAGEPGGPEIPILVSISLQPGDTTLAVGQVIQLRLTGKTKKGTGSPPAKATWKGSNSAVARVSAEGVLTAITPGTVTVTVSCTGPTATTTCTDLTTVATYTIQSAEPVGLAMATERSFDAMNERGWSDDSYKTGNLTIVQDSTALRSPFSVGQVLYPKGYVGGGAPADNFVDFSFKPRTIYVSYWVKLSDNFVGHPSGVNKQVFIWTPYGPEVYLSAQGVGSEQLQPQVRLQGSNLNRNLEPNLVPGARFSRGTWHFWEVVMKGNSDRTADGEIDFWLDGAHVGSYKNVQISTLAVTWTSLMFSPNWGGNGSVVSQDMYLWMDHLYVSGR